MTEGGGTSPGRAWVDGLEVGPLGPGAAETALDVLSRGMRDNPVHLAAFGQDPDLRRKRLRRVFEGAFEAMDWGTNMLAARGSDGTIVGVCGTLPPGACRLGVRQQLRVLPGVLSTGPRVTVRVMRWQGVWAKMDPEGPHWHLGPVAVDAPLQGMGVGSRLMQAFCARVDAVGEAAYLETDKGINVHFYERFGFEVVGEVEVLGVPNWFMSRSLRNRVR